MLRIILAAASLFAANLAVAHDCADSCWYVGGGAGQVSLGSETPTFPFDGDDIGWQVMAGFRVTRNLGVEIAYLSGGEVRDTWSGVPFNIESALVQGSLIGTLPLSESFALHARAGLTNWSAKGQAVASRKDSGGDPVWGGGTSFRMRDIVFRLDYQRTDIEDFNAEFLLFSVLFFM